MNKKIFSVLIIAASCIYSFAQELEENGAFGGGNGIFIYLGEHAVSDKLPVNGISLYKLERKDAGEKDWKPIAEVKLPETADEFSKRLSLAVKNMPYQLPGLEKKAATIWSEYQKYKQVDSVKRWRSLIPVQEAFGLMYHDISVIRGKKYDYRVLECDKNGNPQNTVAFNTTSFPGKNNIMPLKFSKSEPLSSQITMFWYSVEGETPAYLKVERQEKINSKWEPVNTVWLRYERQDTVWFSVTDTTVMRNNMYKHKLIPMDYYGNQGVSSTTDGIAAYNFTIQNPIIYNLQAKSGETEPGIQISWEISRPEMVTSVRIHRSTNWDRDYEQVTELPPAVNSYLDQTVLVNTKYYYYITLTGPQGEITTPSARIFAISDDASAPISPKIVDAAGIPNGIQLKIGTSESDLAGIRIYRRQSIKENFYPVSDLIAVKENITTWRDTSKLILPGSFYSYVVKSENRSGVTSQNSDTIIVCSGRTVKPSKVKSLQGSNKGDYNQLYWINMQQIDPWISGYLVYRKDLPSGTFKLLNDSIIPGDQNSYTDRKIEPGKSYEYTVESVDDFRNKSDQSEPVIVSLPEESVPVPIGVAAAPIDKGIRITWDEVQTKLLSNYKIYRYQRGVKPQLLSQVKPEGALEYIDNTVKPGNLYFYYVTALTTDSREGKPSKEVGVRK